MSQQTEAKTERQLGEQFLRMVANVLGVDEVLPDDSFFELGGTSLSAAILASRVESEMGVAFPVQDIFATPRIAELIEVAAAAGPHRMEGHSDG